MFKGDQYFITGHSNIIQFIHNQQLFKRNQLSTSLQYIYIYSHIYMVLTYAQYIYALMILFKLQVNPFCKLIMTKKNAS